MSNNSSRIRLDRPLAGISAGRKPTDSGGSGQDDSEETALRIRLRQAQRQLNERERALQQREAQVQERERALEIRQHELEERVERLGELIHSVREERAAMLASGEEDIVSFSLSITEKVLQHEIENGRYKMGQVVRSALRAVRDKGSVVVRVNPRDHEVTRTAVERMGPGSASGRIRIVADDSIPLASCCIETDSGKILSEIPGRLKRIESSLLKKNGEPNGV